MDLTKEAIVQIETTAVQAMRATPLPQQPDPRQLVFEAQGKIAKLDVAPPLRNHAVRTLNDLVDYADRLADVEAGEGQQPPQPVIWHGEERVVLVIDDADRRDRVEFQLTYSEQFAAIQKLAAGRTLLDQKTLIRLLRMTLGVDQATVGIFRRLQWSTGADASNQVEKTKDRLGNQIRAEVAGEQELPDDMLVQVPVYREKGEQQTVTVRLMLDYDAYQQKIEIGPAAGEIEAAVDVAQTRIRERIEAKLPDVPVYYGTP